MLKWVLIYHLFCIIWVFPINTVKFQFQNVSCCSFLFTSIFISRVVCIATYNHSLGNEHNEIYEDIWKCAEHPEKMVVSALGSLGSEVDESVARRQGWQISWKRKTWSTVCPGRLEGDTFEEKGPSIKEEGGGVFPPTTGWGRQWVKEKQWQDHTVCHRAPKEKALS